MLKDVTKVKALEGFQLMLYFEDGVAGTVDVADLIEFTGVFKLLRERDYFVQVRVNPDIGTICWPNGADIDPDVLYHLVTGTPIPDFAKESTKTPGD